MGNPRFSFRVLFKLLPRGSASGSRRYVKRSDRPGGSLTTQRLTRALEAACPTKSIGGDTSARSRSQSFKIVSSALGAALALIVCHERESSGLGRIVKCAEIEGDVGRVFV